MNISDIYQNAALAKESRRDAFIKCGISIIYCISASLALEVRGRGDYAVFFVLFCFLRGIQGASYLILGSFWAFFKIVAS